LEIDVDEAPEQSHENNELMDEEVQLDVASNNLEHQEVGMGTPQNQKYAVSNPATTSAFYARRKVSKAPLVMIDVRRSVRLKGKTKGFQTDACNPVKDCLCCSVEPPTLSGRTIRSLGKDFL
jgi:hypothetical protein